MRFALFVFILLLFAIEAKGQREDTVEEVVVTGIRKSPPAGTVLNVEPVKVSVLEEKGPLNLSDALAKIPGISQLSTGSSISRPVIRGLTGNRILVLLDGLRFDNQQWQEEHGMGLPYIGIDRVEVIKGPASVLYGTDALGGVINIIEEQPDTARRHSADGGIRYFSNTRGTLSDIGYKYSAPDKSWRIRAGIESHADYTDGNRNRVLNSRSNGYYLKSGYSAVRNKWKTQNAYNFSWSNFGFIMQDLRDVFSPDARWARKMAGPHHAVLLNVFSSQNDVQLRSSILRINGGVQSNLRMEDEGGGQISLNMHLLSLLSHARWEKHIAPHTLLVLNNQLTFESNTNYGARIIIPDARLWEASFSAFLSRVMGKVVAEAGAGIGDKLISTFETGRLNRGASEIHPFRQNRLSANGLAGIAFAPTHSLTVKANAATGFRAPNLAELSSNGLHEGIFHYEIGNPDLRIEQNLNTELSAELSRSSIFASVSAFRTMFFNYIYLAPTGEQRLGFPVYRFLQQDARLYGGEAQVRWLPQQWLQASASYALVNGMLADGSYLPFIPPQKFTGSVRFSHARKGRTLREMYAEPEWVYVMRQDKTARNETATPEYSLLNFYAGAGWQLYRQRKLDISISGLNLLDAAYADHLSRLKDFGILNPGRNISLNIHFTI